ncbi:Uncharacterized protein Fot_24285 [Forsythia ovata]|uniref:Uncharacterized protein n=1 Tax=Forsythia ovata TaxID=205694 RepID=A0ABD1U5T3_9LAMI
MGKASSCRSGRGYSFSNSVVGWLRLPPELLPGASIHQRRLKVLSEPCWIVTHHTTLKPNLWWIPGDKVKALDPLPHTLRCSSPSIKDFGQKGSIPDQAPLKAMDDYLFSLRPSEQLFLLFLNQLHLIWEGGPVSVLKVVPERMSFLKKFKWVFRTWPTLSSSTSMESKSGPPPQKIETEDTLLRTVNLRRVNRSLRNPRKGCRPMGTRK